MIKRDITQHEQAIQNAYCNTSWTPDERAKQDMEAYNNTVENTYKVFCDLQCQDLFSDWEDIYFNKKMRVWNTQSRCLSSMITGPANFPVARARKAGAAHENATRELIQFIDNIKGYIYRKRPDLKLQHENQQKEDSIIADIKQELAGGRVVNAGTPYAYTYRIPRPLLAGRIKTLIRRGKADTLKTVFELLEQGDIFAKNNSIFEDYEKFLAKQDEKANSEDATNYIVAGVKVFENEEIDRIQLFFDGKPEPDMITKLKKNAFKWSPRGQCWQRQLTDNARRATADFMNDLARGGLR